MGSRPTAETPLARSTISVERDALGGGTTGREPETTPGLTIPSGRGQIISQLDFIAVETPPRDPSAVRVSTLFHGREPGAGGPGRARREGHLHVGSGDHILVR